MTFTWGVERCWCVSVLAQPEAAILASFLPASAPRTHLIWLVTVSAAGGLTRSLGVVNDEKQAGLAVG